MRKITLLLPLLLLLPVLGCQKNVPAVARLDVQPRAVRLPFPQLTTLHLTWNLVAPLGGDASGEPTVFVHLLDAKAQLLRTFDHPFPQRWSEGSAISDDLKIYQSLLAPPLDPGKYRLSVGLYDRSGKRWPLDGLGQQIGRREYLGSEIEVPRQSEVPQLSFSPTWLPTEAGTDRQVVARRWLSDQQGSFLVSNLHPPGTLWLMIRIPAGDGPGETMVLPNGASNAPSVQVRSNCGSFETGISGAGPHEIEVPFDGTGATAADSPAGCRIVMVPNFHVASAAVPQARSVSLENAAWIPGKSASAGQPATAAAGTGEEASTQPLPPAAGGGPEKPPGQ